MIRRVIVHGYTLLFGEFVLQAEERLFAARSSRNSPRWRAYRAYISEAVSDGWLSCSTECGRCLVRSAGLQHDADGRLSPLCAPFVIHPDVHIITRLVHGGCRFKVDHFDDLRI